MRGYYHRCRPEKLAMVCEADRVSPRLDAGRFSRPDVEGPAQLADQRGVLEDKGDRLHESNEGARQHGVDDVVGNRLDLREAVVRRHVHQLVLSHPDLTRGVSQAPPERADRALEENLRVPEVGLEEQELSTRLEQAVDLLEIQPVG